MKWFKHDSNASVDAKLERVIMKYGMEGYGLYWYCLETIARSVEKHNLTFELEHDAEVIAHRTGIHYEKVEEMMTYMVNLRLFENSEGIITCLKMRTRTDEYTQKLLNTRSIVGTVSGQNPERVGKKSELIEENRIEENRIETKTLMSSRSANDVPYQKIVDLYHELLPASPKVRVLTPARKSSIKQRHIHDMDCSLEEWESYFGLVSRSKFLTGQVQPVNGRKVFVADLEWICKQGNFAKIYEGKYHG